MGARRRRRKACAGIFSGFLLHAGTFCFALVRTGYRGSGFTMVKDFLVVNYCSSIVVWWGEKGFFPSVALPLFRTVLKQSPGISAIVQA